MDLLTAHRTALRQFDNRVRLIRPDQWTNTTPDTEWTVRDLVSHLVYEQLWVPDLLAGRTIEEVGDRFDGDVLGDHPVAAWESASTAARAAFLGPGALDQTVHLSFGDTPAREYGWQMVIDLAVHAWDLARGISDDDALPNDLAGEVLIQVKLRESEYTASGLFAPPIDVSACTDDQSELLARLGRQRWKLFTPIATG